MTQTENIPSVNEKDTPLVPIDKVVAFLLCSLKHKNIRLTKAEKAAAVQAKIQKILADE